MSRARLRSRHSRVRYTAPLPQRGGALKGANTCFCPDDGSSQRVSGPLIDSLPMDAETWTRAEAAFPAVIAEGATGAARAMETITKTAPDVARCLRPAVDAYVSQSPASAFEPTLPPFSRTGNNRIGRYSILREIGRGGMGAVYLAHDPEIGRAVALKLLTRGDDRFLDEVRAAGNLKHPNIVTIYDAARIDGRSVIVMEHIEGRTLHDLIRKHRLGPLAARLQLLRQLCEAIDHAHDRGIIHRDIKPSNLIVDKGGQLKVLDFGIARMAEPSFRTAHDFAGTLRYMSPEQMNARDLDRRSDIFAVGVVAYEMLCYRHPFERASAVRLAYAICHEAPEALTRLAPLLDPRLCEIVARALEKDPRDRYTTLSAMLTDLRGLDGPAEGVAETPRGRERSADGTSPRERHALLSPWTWLALVLPILAAMAVVAVMLKPAIPSVRATPPVDPNAPASAAASAYETGTRLIKGGGPLGLARGIGVLEDSCNAGERRACRDLGSIFDAGTSVARNLPRAVGLYQKGCAGGELRSCLRLAKLYRGNQGIAADLAAAAEVSARACGLGSFAECNNLGVASVEGSGVPQNKTEGTSLLSRACENDIAVACVNVARLLLSATGRERDPRRAVALLERGCDLGYAGGCTEAAAMYGTGTDVAKDVSRANGLRRRARQLPSVETARQPRKSSPLLLADPSAGN